METKIYSTYDYSRFKYVRGNREINHVRAVAKSIEKLDATAFSPVLVTKDFEVLDGQNRLEACKLLKKPVYYIICDLDAPKSAIIQALNNSQRNWRTEDYVKSWFDLENQNIKDFVFWAQKYGFDNRHYGVAVKVYCGSGHPITNLLKYGNLTDKWQYADEVGNWLVAVKEKNVPYWNNSYFVEGVVRFRLTHTAKDMAKILRHIDKIAQFGSSQSYVNRFQQIVDAIKVR